MSGLNCVIPNGSTAPGKVDPDPPPIANSGAPCPGAHKWIDPTQLIPLGASQRRGCECQKQATGECPECPGAPTHPDPTPGPRHQGKRLDDPRILADLRATRERGRRRAAPQSCSGPYIWRPAIVSPMVSTRVVASQASARRGQSDACAALGSRAARPFPAALP